MEERFGLKTWEIVDYENPVTFTGYTISKVTKQGKAWYTMDMIADIEAFFAEAGGYVTPSVSVPV